MNSKVNELQVDSSEKQNNFIDLSKINVNNHTEKKGKFTYLSWTFAVSEAMKADPSKTVDELIEAERAYVEAVSVASSTISSGAFGTVEEAKSINPADELNAIVSRIAGK